MSIENVSQAPTAPATPVLDTSNVEDYSQRIHLVHEAAKAEAKELALESDASEDAEALVDSPEAEGEEKPKEKEAPKDEPEPPPLAAAPAEPSPEDKARKASLANAARLERESVRKSTELASKAAELKAKELHVTEREAKLVQLEKAFNDPDALLELLSEKIGPDKMSAYFIEAGQPDKVAERRAKAAQEPVSAEITKLREEMKALKAEADTAKAQIARAASEKDFAARVLDIKSDAPHAARLLAKRPKEFFAMADMAATHIMAAAQAEGRKATWDDVILDVNNQLLEFTRDLQDEAPAQAPSTPEKSSKSLAAAKAPTVSNRAASERSAILEEDEKWDGLPFDERVRRAEKRARQTG